MNFWHIRGLCSKISCNFHGIKRISHYKQSIYLNNFFRYCGICDITRTNTFAYACHQSKTLTNSKHHCIIGGTGTCSRYVCFYVCKKISLTSLVDSKNHIKIIILKNISLPASKVPFIMFFEALIVQYNMWRVQMQKPLNAIWNFLL